jgi:hypothetical protein
MMGFAALNPSYAATRRFTSRRSFRRHPGCRPPNPADNALTHHAMKCRVRPILNAANVAMFDRVEMDVIDMVFEILFVPQGVLPIAALPDRALAFVGAARGKLFVIGKYARKRALDQPPAQGVIGVPVRQHPDGVEMVRKHDRRRDLERMPRPGIVERRAQRRNMFDEQAPAAVKKVYGEEIAAAGDKITPEVRHGTSPSDGICGNAACERRRMG